VACGHTRPVSILEGFKWHGSWFRHGGGGRGQLGWAPPVVGAVLVAVDGADTADDTLAHREGHGALLEQEHGQLTLGEIGVFGTGRSVDEREGGEHAEQHITEFPDDVRVHGGMVHADFEGAVLVVGVVPVEGTVAIAVGTTAAVAVVAAAAGHEVEEHRLEDSPPLDHVIALLAAEMLHAEMEVDAAGLVDEATGTSDGLDGIVDGIDQSIADSGTAVEFPATPAAINVLIEGGDAAIILDDTELLQVKFVLVLQGHDELELEAAGHGVLVHLESGGLEVRRPATATHMSLLRAMAVVGNAALVLGHDGLVADTAGPETRSAVAADRAILVHHGGLVAEMAVVKVVATMAAELAPASRAGVAKVLGSNAAGHAVIWSSGSRDGCFELVAETADPKGIGLAFGRTTGETVADVVGHALLAEEGVAGDGSAVRLPRAGLFGDAGALVRGTVAPAVGAEPGPLGRHGWTSWW